MSRRCPASGRHLEDFANLQNTAKKRIGVNEHGRRVGESHHRAKLTDAEVDAIRALRDEGGFSIAQIADWFDHVSVATVRAICRYRRRVQFAARFKRGT